MKKIKLMVLISPLLLSSVYAQSFQDGIKAFDYENFETAKNIFKKLISQQPGEAKNYYYLGQTYYNLGVKDSSRLAYNAGMQADPKSIYNYIGMGSTYLDQNNTQKANEYFGQVKGLTSQKDITQYILIADAYINNSHPDCQQAITQLNRAVEYNNKNADVYYELGAANECLNKGGDAVSAFERAAELNPSFAKAYTRVGVIWRLARNYNQSLVSFQKALTADANFPPAFREMAELYFYTGQFDKAKDTFKKYMDLADKDDYTQFRYAKFLFLTKDYQQALDILNPLRSKIDDPIMWRLSAYSNYELGNYPEGMEQIMTFFKKADQTRILSSDYEYYAKLLSKSSQDSLAILNYQKAIDMDTSKISLYSEIGGILFQEKKYHDAAFAYKKKVQASPKDAGLQDYFNVGKSFYFSKEFMQADSAFADMTVLNKLWPIGYFWRARVMTNLDNPDSVKGLAAPFYNQVIERAMVDTAKYVKELTESYKYLGDVNALQENYGAALYYYGKYIALDPSSTEVPKTIESVKALYKNSSSSSMALQKDSTGYLIPVVINNNTINFTYDPAVGGLAASTEGARSLGSASESGTVKTDLVKISDRTLKDAMLIVMPDLKEPFAIGSGVLNKLNMVFDYGSGTLLIR